jgi:aspartate aminotransferase
MNPALLASRLSSVQPSATDAVSQLARKLAAEGRSIINLSIGEPDVNTPEHVKRAAIAAMERNETKYTAVPGTLGLREAISKKFWRENGLTYPEDQVTIGCGGKQVIYNAFVATLDPGDEVIVPAPYWLSYPDMVSLAGGTPVIVPTLERDGFKLRPEMLEAVITPRTKWLVLNSPSNPTGAVYSDDELRAVLEVLLNHPHVLLLADDLYEHLIYDGIEFTSCAKLEPRLLSRTLTLNGVSKAYAMTGWRVGYAGGPADLIRAINTVQSQTVTHTSSISQAAAVAALNAT